jgi:hypothetical protein
MLQQVAWHDAPLPNLIDQQANPSFALCKNAQRFVGPGSVLGALRSQLDRLCARAL